MKDVIRTKTTRNQSVEFCKLVAAFFVVIIHTGFSEDAELRGTMDCIARFAVPYFFAVSGYYSYQVNDQKLFSRIKHVFRYNLIGTAIYAVWGAYQAWTQNGQHWSEYLKTTLSEYRLAILFVQNINPFKTHLWYLVSLLFCYIILWAYARFHAGERIKYQPLYILGTCLLMFQFVLGTYALSVGLEIRYHIYRNALFFGFPMLVMGIFLREYGEHIMTVFKLNPIKLIVAIWIFGWLSVIQYNNIGKVEMPIPTVLEVIAIVLLTTSYPRILPECRMTAKIESSLSNIATIIYIIHPLLIDIYKLKFIGIVSDATTMDDYKLMSIIVYTGSFLVAIIFTYCMSLVNKIFGKYRNRF